MRLFGSLFAAVLLSVFSIPAHADIITTFTLTHGSDTIRFSISDATLPYSMYPTTTGEEIDYRVPLTVNGVEHVTEYSPGDLGVETFESLQPAGIGSEFLVGYRVGFVNGVAQYRYYFEQGLQVYADVNGAIVFTPAENPVIRLMG